MCLFHIDSIFTKIKIIYWLASKIVSQIIAQLQALFSITCKLFPPSFHQVRLRVILLSSEFHTLACFHEMFIGTRTNVILKDELLLTFFYQLLWWFYPFYWSCLDALFILFGLKVHTVDLFVCSFLLLFSSCAGSTWFFPCRFVRRFLISHYYGQYGCF